MEGKHKQNHIIGHWRNTAESAERGKQREKGGDHAGQNLTLTMCTEMKSLKLNPHIPLALWQAWEMLLRCTWHSILPYLSLRWWWTSAVYLHFRIRFHAFRLSSSCIFLDHPPNSSRELAQSKFSLAQCQGFHPGQWERCQPHASTLTSTSATNTLWQRKRQFTHTHTHYDMTAGPPTFISDRISSPINLENTISHLYAPSLLFLGSASH